MGIFINISKTQNNTLITFFILQNLCFLLSYFKLNNLWIEILYFSTDLQHLIYFTLVKIWDEIQNIVRKSDFQGDVTQMSFTDLSTLTTKYGLKDLGTPLGSFVKTTFVSLFLLRKKELMTCLSGTYYSNTSCNKTILKLSLFCRELKIGPCDQYT